MQLINLIAIVVGIYCLFGVIVQPALFWDSKRMKHRREYMGEQKTRIMYGTLGVILLLVGLLTN